MEQSSQLMLTYCKSLSLEFRQRVDRMQLFVKNNLTSGNAREAILRNFLRSYVPSGYQVEQGFIFDAGNLSVSRQCDILVYSSHQPVSYADGEVKIVQKEAARMVIEVKTIFDSKSITTALENIRAAKTVSPYLHSCIFSFRSPNLMTVIKNLHSQKNFNSELGPDAILLFDKNIIIHRWSIARHDDVPPPLSGLAYSVREGLGEEKDAVVVMTLFMAFLNSVGSFDPARPQNLLRNTIKTYTKCVFQDFQFGSQ